MIWNTSPLAFKLAFGSWQFQVFWYGLFFASTFLYGYLLFIWIFRREGRPVNEVSDLLLMVMAGTIIGARLGHILFYDPGYYFSHPEKILSLREGGLASHGAVAGILMAVWLYSRHATRQSFLWVCDRIGMAVPLSGCLIRLGNFFNSEILGTPANVPWAVVFSRIDTIPRHPVQLYESLAYLLIFLLQFTFYLKRGDGGTEGYLFGRFLVLVFSARFVIEFFKEGQAAFESGWPLTVGQLLSIPIMLTGACLILKCRPKNEKSG